MGDASAEASQDLRWCQCTPRNGRLAMNTYRLFRISLLSVLALGLSVGLAPAQGPLMDATVAFSARTPSRVRMEEMTSTEIDAAIRAGKTTVLIFNASTEASGPALALGKHIVRARYLGERIAGELGNALLAPVMPFAPVSDEKRFPGTIDLSAETFARVNEEVALSMAKAGFKHIVLMGDHDGNQPSLKALAAKLDERLRSQGVRVLYSSDAYSKSNVEIAAWLEEHGYPPSRHAGISDTSMTWALDENYVRPNKLVVGAPVPPAGSPLALGEIGVEGDPRRSSPERRFIDLRIRNGVAEIRRLVEDARQPAPPLN
jgi:creatinine amidohydrolase/Fe(II)-dependent formamide hydrolase-like protein